MCASFAFAFTNQQIACMWFWFRPKYAHSKLSIKNTNVHTHGDFIKTTEFQLLNRCLATDFGEMILVVRQMVFRCSWSVILERVVKQNYAIVQNRI